MSGCCQEYRCRRKHPILVRQGPLSGRWFAITDYVVKNHPLQRPGAPPLLEARQKHDVTDELIAALIHAGWSPPPSDPPQSAGDRTGTLERPNLEAVRSAWAATVGLELCGCGLLHPPDSPDTRWP